MRVKSVKNVEKYLEQSETWNVTRRKKHQKEQADLSVNSNHSDGDRNGNATVQIQDALGDALNVDMIIVTK